MNEPINIILAPTVVVLSRQVVDRAGLAAWTGLYGAEGWQSDVTEAGDVLPEIAGRSCYGSFANPRPGGNAAYISHVIDEGHTSVLEHAVWTLGIAGISRSCSHQLVRHRVGLSPSQLSQRFYDESECSFVLPPALMGVYQNWLSNPPEPEPSDAHVADCWLYTGWQFICGEALSFYREITRDLMGRGLTRKQAREAARSVLPECVETRIVFTGNARAWRHFLALRGSEHADAEIRRLAVAVAETLQAEAPNVFADVAIQSDGVSVGGADRAGG